MSPRFEPDLSDTRASTRIYERGEYLLKVTDVQGILYMKDPDDEREPYAVAGVRTGFDMVAEVNDDGSLDDEFAGEDVSPDRHYVHSEGAWPFTKRFLMAAFGYDLDDEEEFDEWQEDWDWSLDGDPESDEDPELGDGWKELEGQEVIATLDKRIQKDEETGEEREFQDFAGYMPA